MIHTLVSNADGIQSVYSCVDIIGDEINTTKYHHPHWVPKTPQIPNTCRSNTAPRP